MLIPASDWVGDSILCYAYFMSMCTLDMAINMTLTSPYKEARALFFMFIGYGYKLLTNLPKLAGRYFFYKAV